MLRLKLRQNSPNAVRLICAPKKASHSACAKNSGENVDEIDPRCFRFTVIKNIIFRNRLAMLLSSPTIFGRTLE